MTLFTFVLFVHVIAAMGLFGALAIEGVLLWRLQRAPTAAEADDALRDFRVLRILMPLGFVTTVLSGMYLMANTWRFQAPWLNVALISLALTIAAGVGTRFLRRGYSPLLWASFVTRTILFGGIVFLMTVKPGLEDALLAMAAALGAAAVASLAAVRAARGHAVDRSGRQPALHGGRP